MLKNISLGIYYPGNSLLHRLQARTKLLILLWLLVVLVIANHREWHFAPFIVLGVLPILAVPLAGISYRHMWQRMWFLTLVALLGGIPLLFFHGNSASKVIYTLGPLLISYPLLQQVILIYGILLTTYVLVFLLPIPILRNLRQHRWFKLTRMLFLVLTLIAVLTLWLTHSMPLSSTFPVGPLVITQDSVWHLIDFFTAILVLYALALLLTMTTSPVNLIEGLTMLLAPLRRLRLPVDDFALMTLIALRFIPTLLEEVEQLIKAQTARGADVTQGTIRERLQSLSSLFIPFMQGALRRASDLATALEARGYQTEGHQTRLHEKSFGVRDYVVFATIVLVTVGALVL